MTSRARERVAEHPGVAGRRDELTRLVEALRRVNAACATRRASPRSTDELAKVLHRVAEELEAFPLEPVVPAQLEIDSNDLHERTPFDPVIGRMSPLAVPVIVSREPPGAVGRATFREEHEGPPGCVHGGWLAASFDMVLHAANRFAGYQGPTRRLELRYRRPTRLREEVRFEASLESVSEEAAIVRGRAQQRGESTVEAIGEFRILTDQGWRSIGDRRR
jgi:acyl-coenzyme A thioesterase PaaI-like protein